MYVLVLYCMYFFKGKNKQKNISAKGNPQKFGLTFVGDFDSCVTHVR